MFGTQNISFQSHSQVMTIKSFFRTFSYCLVCAAMACSSPSDTNSPTPPEAESVDAIKTAQTMKKVLCFGNSLTAGYGLDRDSAFTSILQRRIDSLGWPAEIINAGVSGETTSGGLSRLEWMLNEPIDIFILELGANDGLRGINPAETEKNLQAMIDAVWKKNPNIPIILAGMQVPPNMGDKYIDAFRSIYPRLAEKNQIYLIPFLLQGVAGIPALNQADGIHPNNEGEKIVAEVVWQYLEPVLKKVVN